MMKKLYKCKKFPYLYIGLFAFLFFMISRWTPLAGDDWGYAYNGMTGNAFALTLHNYLTWSGRVLAEFWGFTIAQHKHLWDILNTASFTGILVMMYAFVKDEKKKVTSLLLMIVLILSVPGKVRMQTYTWIMGTTYVIPLFLFLMYLFLVRKTLFRETLSAKAVIGCYALNALIPLYMENAAAMLTGVNACILVYCYFFQKKSLPQFLKFFVVSVIATCMIGLSPGAASRLASDNAAFEELSIFQKIGMNWSSFIGWTFTRPAILISTLGIVSLLYVCQHGKTMKYRMLWMIGLIAGTICTGFPVPVLLSTLIFTLYTVSLFVIALSFPQEEERWMGVLILLAAGGANLVMLLSPIFDARSALYTIFLFILFTALVTKQITLQKHAHRASVILLLLSFVVLINHYYSIYALVHQIDLKRQKQIAYYQVRPDMEDAYILGFPADTIHSADVIPGDDYHDVFFKKYYYLNEEMHVHFYYLDQYTPEEIEAQ